MAEEVNLSNYTAKIIIVGDAACGIIKDLFKNKFKFRENEFN